MENMENESEVDLRNDMGQPLPNPQKALIVGSAKSKTIWFSFAVMLLGFLESNPEFRALIPEQYNGLVISGIGFCSMCLRFVTTSALTDK